MTETQEIFRQSSFELNPYCCGKDCHRISNYQIILKVLPMGSYVPKTVHMSVLMAVGVCDDHKGEVKIDDIFTNDAKIMLTEGFESMGLKEPDIDGANMVYRPVDFYVRH